MEHGKKRSWTELYTHELELLFSAIQDTVKRTLLVAGCIVCGDGKEELTIYVYLFLIIIIID